MYESLEQTKVNCRKTFSKLLRLCEPEILLLGEVGFLNLITNTPNITTFGEDICGLSIHFEKENVYYATVSSEDEKYFIHPRIHLPIEQAMSHWNQLIQERL